MPQTATKDALRTLLEEVATRNLSLEELRGTALFNSERDAVIKALSSFEAAKQTVSNIPNFIGRFGAAASEPIVLQFVYQYFERTETVHISLNIGESHEIIRF